MPEFRISGPPGTGKTTFIANKLIPPAVDKYGIDKVMVTSFSRTAAKEIASRQLPIPDVSVGTLHSLCYRALGHPELVFKKLKDWNAAHPEFRIDERAASVSVDMATNVDLSQGGSLQGEQLLAFLDKSRSKMLSIQRTSTSLIRFAKLWTNFKQDTGTIDFADMIELCLQERLGAPGDPDVIIVDEVQDLTPLQIALVRQWGKNAKEYYMVGDDDQCIFAFSGASPTAYLKPDIDAKFKKVLDQSYRVPRAVHALASNIVSQISFREEKTYRPKEVEGNVRIMEKCNWKEPYAAVKDSIWRYKEGKSVMFLASCAYMLDPIKLYLMDNGVPFGNLYRPNRKDWNPLLSGMGENVQAIDLLTNFLGKGPDENYWTIPQFVTWANYLSVGDSGLIRAKGKKVIEALNKAIDQKQEGLFSARNVIDQVLSPAAIDAAMRRDVEWFCETLKADRQKTIKYPATVLKNFGLNGIKKAPYATLGTVHSVKGAEADVVYVFPDIPYASFKNLWANGYHKANIDQWDEMYRLFYVAVTRAKEEVVLLQPAAPQREVSKQMYFDMRKYLSEQKEAA